MFRLFCLQNCLSRKASISRKQSKPFSPGELSQLQVIGFPKNSDFFACRTVLAASHWFPEIFRLFCLQNCLSRKASKSRKYSKPFSPGELSQLQVIGFPKNSDFFACRTVLAASHWFPEIFRPFCLQNCLSRTASISRKYSKPFSPAEMSEPQIINIPEIFKDFFACRTVLAASHWFPEMFRLFCLQNCLSRKASISRKYSKPFSPGELSQLQVIGFPKNSDFFACRTVLAASHWFPEIFRLFCLQNCLSRKASKSRKYSKPFLPGELSQLQVIGFPKNSDFFACRTVLAASHWFPEIFRPFCLQNCLSRTASISRKYSKPFSPAEMSEPQIINIPEIFKDFFACRNILAAYHQYPGNIRRLFCLQNFFSRKSSISRKTPKTFSPAELSQQQIIDIPEIIKHFSRLQNCLSRKSPISRKYSKSFSPAEISQPQIINIPKYSNTFSPAGLSQQQIIDIPEKFIDISRLQNCLSRKSSISRKYSQTYWLAELSQPHVISIPKIFEGFFACRIVLTANHQYPGNIQRHFRLQNCLSCRSSVYRNIQRNFFLQICLSLKSSISRKYSKSFSHAELSYPQIISIPELFKDFFTCRNVLAANHQYPGTIQRLFGLQKCLSPKSSISRKYSKSFRLQNCFRRKSSKSRKYSKTFSPAELSQQQIIDIPEIFKDFFTCRTVLAANHQYPENTQRLFACRNVLGANHQNPGNIQRLFRLQNCLSTKSLISRKCSKTFLACRFVLAERHQYPGNTQRFFCLQNCLSRKSSISRKYSKTFRLQNCLRRKSSKSRKYSKTFSPAELSQHQIIDIPEMFKDFSRLQNCLSRKTSISGKYSKIF